MGSQLRYPVYVVSKGRAHTTQTARYFERDGIPFKFVIESQEKEQYFDKLGKHKCLVLPFSNLGLGSYPARNFCWEHAKKEGHKRHWVFDDNILGFSKWQHGKKVYGNYGCAPLMYVENFADANDVHIAGFQGHGFSMRPPPSPWRHNVKVYSAMLIDCDMPYRWRLKYNEDVDLCLQVLHNGGKTASCMYYLANKEGTPKKHKGGNQDELYKGNHPKKKLLKAKMLEAVWPQYAKTVIRFNRYHHFVDWKMFSKQSSKQP